MLLHLGIVFRSDVLGAVDLDAGGTFCTASELSGNTSLTVFGGEIQAFVTVLGRGFTGLPFQYAAANAMTVSVCAGPNTPGALLSTISLTKAALCGVEVPECGDPHGYVGVWENISVPFVGVAKSARFSSPGWIHVDDMMIKLAVPPTKQPTTAPTNAPTSAYRSHKGMNGDVKRCMMMMKKKKKKKPKAA